MRYKDIQEAGSAVDTNDKTVKQFEDAIIQFAKRLTTAAPNSDNVRTLKLLAQAANDPAKIEDIMHKIINAKVSDDVTNKTDDVNLIKIGNTFTISSARCLVDPHRYTDDLKGMSQKLQDAAKLLNIGVILYSGDLRKAANTMLNLDERIWDKYVDNRISDYFMKIAAGHRPYKDVREDVEGDTYRETLLPRLTNLFKQYNKLGINVGSYEHLRVLAKTMKKYYEALTGNDSVQTNKCEKLIDKLLSATIPVKPVATTSNKKEQSLAKIQFQTTLYVLARVGSWLPDDIDMVEMVLFDAADHMKIAILLAQGQKDAAYKVTRSMDSAPRDYIDSRVWDYFGHGDIGESTDTKFILANEKLTQPVYFTGEFHPKGNVKVYANNSNVAKKFNSYEEAEQALKDLLSNPKSKRSTEFYGLEVIPFKEVKPRHDSRGFMKNHPGYDLMY